MISIFNKYGIPNEKNMPRAQTKQNLFILISLVSLFAFVVLVYFVYAVAQGISLGRERRVVTQERADDLFAYDPLIRPARPQRPMSPTVTALDPVRGSDDAPVTIVEFADFQCPHCASMDASLQKVMIMYPGKIRYIWKDFVIQAGSLSIHQAARCAQLQDKFWEYHDALFARSPDIVIDSLVDIARDRGLDMNDFSSCLKDPNVEAWVLDSSREARDLDITSVPTTFINNERFEGALSDKELRGLIDSFLDQ